jgi:hypothetical protein
MTILRVSRSCKLALNNLAMKLCKVWNRSFLPPDAEAEIDSEGKDHSQRLCPLPAIGAAAASKDCQPSFEVCLLTSVRFGSSRSRPRNVSVHAPGGSVSSPNKRFLLID